MKTEDEAKRQTYYKLIIDAIRAIRRHKGEQSWEQDDIEELTQTNKAAQHVMLIPGIKRLAEQYHPAVHKHKDMAEKEVQRCNKIRHEAKGEGRWAICKAPWGRGCHHTHTHKHMKYMPCAARITLY